MEIAETISKRATCKRGSNGCVITIDDRIVSSGYNGPISNQPHCHEKYCDLSKPCIRSVHAEANAIYAAARQGIKLEGAIIYSTSRPCEKCFQAISSSGISKVYYRLDYTTDLKSKNEIELMFNLAGIKLVKL